MNDRTQQVSHTNVINSVLIEEFKPENTRPSPSESEIPQQINLWLLKKKTITSGFIVSAVDPSPYLNLFFPRNCMIQLICVAKGTGLGLVIRGGANRAEGPMVFVQEIMQGGDCQKVCLCIIIVNL